MTFKKRSLNNGETKEIFTPVGCIYPQSFVVGNALKKSYYLKNQYRKPLLPISKPRYFISNELKMWYLSVVLFMRSAQKPNRK